MKLSQLFAVSLLFVSFSSHAGLVHQYRFDGSLADDQGGPSLVALGGTVTGGRYVFDANQGLVLNENLGAKYTLDFLYNFASQSGYRKLVDYATGTSDKGVYTNAGIVDFYTNGSHIAAGGGTMNNVDSQVTVTRDALGIMNAYVDRQLVLTLSGSTNALVFGDVARFFMDDGVQGTEASAGQVDFIRIFDSALTGAEVAALGAPLPPAGHNVPEPASAALVLAGIGILGLARRRQRGR